MGTTCESNNICVAEVTQQPRQQAGRTPHSLFLLGGPGEDADFISRCCCHEAYAPRFCCI